MTYIYEPHDSIDPQRWSRWWSISNKFSAYPYRFLLSPYHSCTTRIRTRVFPLQVNRKLSSDEVHRKDWIEVIAQNTESYFSALLCAAGATYVLHSSPQGDPSGCSVINRSKSCNIPRERSWTYIFLIKICRLHQSKSWAASFIQEGIPSQFRLLDAWCST